MNNVKILFFATLRDCVGLRSLEIQIPPQINIEGFKSILTEKFPALNGLTSHILISVNQQYALDEAMIPDDAEIALFPPVSGG